MELQTVHKDKMISTFSPPWNFKLTWTARKDQVISTFPPPWNFKLSTRIRYIKIPIPWNFKLTWTVREDKMISKFPPHGTSNGLGLSTRIR